MAIEKNNNSWVFFLIILILFTFLFFTRSAYASEISDTDIMITAFPKMGDNNIVVYDSESDNYNLISFDGEPILNNNLLDMSKCSTVGGFYHWDKTYKQWVAHSYDIHNNYEMNKNEYILYSSKNIKDAKGEVVFYKTDEIINNKVYHSINTVFTQNFNKYIKNIFIVAIVLFSMFCGIRLLSSIFKKFVR